MGLLPNIGISIKHDSTHRNGLSLHTMDAKVSNLRKNTIQYIAPRLYNHLPKYIRNHDGSMDSFKLQLDEFLALIPDEPRLKKGSKMYSNTLENQLINWTWILKNNYYQLVRAQLSSI